jgi:protein arginine N-methyltransferase 5
LTRSCLQAYNDLAHLETPYVVKLHRYSLIAEPKEVFTFQHPNLVGRCSLTASNPR